MINGNVTEGISAARVSFDRTRCATINKLPPDVLLLIFHELRRAAQEALEWRFPTVGQSNSRLPPSYKNRARKYPFPESIASVCRHWREVMSTTSSFWIRLVIWIGQKGTPLPDICDYLAWSRDRLLDIYVLSDMHSSATEKAQVDAIMELLVPHMQRWQALYMNVLHSSSLPRPRIDLVGHADNLIELEQLFSVDDSVVAEAADSVIGEFHTPQLDVLRTSGLHFRESYVKPFPRYPMPASLGEIKILGYGDHHPAFPLVDLLTCLVSCEELNDIELADLALDLSYTGPPVPRPNQLWGPHCSFVDLPGDAIAEYDRLLDYSFTEMMSYTRCSLENPVELCDSYWIDLNEIESPISLKNFLAPVPSSEVLSFTDCDGLLPMLLLILANPWRVGELWLCPKVKSLIIKGCTRFSSSHLRKLVEERRFAHAATGYAEDSDPEFVVHSITNLDVYGCCKLDSGDKEWFNENLRTVRWDNWTGGTNRRSDLDSSDSESGS
ncbi:hypothetical protein EVJ58_g9530 [Rhodofomes roseus]|uniref:Uncharacterized protein n=1 Tax=Rhodofomes roseus TaxID=34475 RepID=A0A4Y9XVW7_9APHY|nr:hypothetical protein EVJ58_g9530 [Rhodofomes roseus]